MTTNAGRMAALDRRTSLALAAAATLTTHADRLGIPLTSLNVSADDSGTFAPTVFAQLPANNRTAVDDLAAALGPGVDVDVDSEDPVPGTDGRYGRRSPIHAQPIRYSIFCRVTHVAVVPSGQ